MLKLSLIGNIGQDPETKQLPSGKTLFSFSVAVTTYFKKEEHTQWFSISIFDDKFDRLKPNLTKGSRVYIVGSFNCVPSNKDPSKTLWNVSPDIIHVVYAKKTDTQEKTYGGPAPANGGKFILDEEIPF